MQQFNQKFLLKLGGLLSFLVVISAFSSRNVNETSEKLNHTFLSNNGALTQLSQVSTTHKIPFQGRLTNNGSPVNGTKSIVFTIGSWTETHSNITVTDGLYFVVLGSINPIPSTVLNTGNSIMLNITVDNQALLPVEIFPDVDKDPTNELQILTLSGDTLRLSNGNSVLLTGGSPDRPFRDDLQVGNPDTTAAIELDQPISTGDLSLDTVYQSFVTVKSGNLTELTVNISNLNHTDLILNVYDGEGINGTLLFTQQYDNIAFSPISSLQTFLLDANNQPYITATKKYTFQIIGVSDHFVISVNDNNPYSQGFSSLGSSKDLLFSLRMDYIRPISLMATVSGDIGIGTDIPGARLEVKGENYDSTKLAFLVTNSIGDTLFYVRNDGQINGYNWLNNGIKIGTGTWTVTGINQTKTITHNLGKIPRLIEINWYSNSASQIGEGKGMYTNGQYSTLYKRRYSSYNTAQTPNITSSYIIYNSTTSYTNAWSAIIENNNPNSFTLKSSSYSGNVPIIFTWKVIY